jgi:hypothetical protein
MLEEEITAAGVVVERAWQDGPLDRRPHGPLARLA